MQNVPEVHKFPLYSKQSPQEGRTEGPSSSKARCMPCRTHAGGAQVAPELYSVAGCVHLSCQNQKHRALRFAFCSASTAKSMVLTQKSRGEFHSTFPGPQAFLSASLAWRLVFFAP